MYRLSDETGEWILEDTSSGRAMFNHCTSERLCMDNDGYFKGHFYKGDNNSDNVFTLMTTKMTKDANGIWWNIAMMEKGNCKEYFPIERDDNENPIKQ
jgi:hypothetical protein